MTKLWDQIGELLDRDDERHRDAGKERATIARERYSEWMRRIRTGAADAQNQRAFDDFLRDYRVASDEQNVEPDGPDYSTLFMGEHPDAYEWGVDGREVS